MQDFFARNLYCCSTPEAVPYTAVLKSLEQDKFACIRGLIAADSVRQARSKLVQHFNRDRDHPTVGEAPVAVQTNFQKLSVGSVHGKTHHNNYARLLRTFYNPLWAEDIYGMHDTFRTMTLVRNRLINKPDNFAQDQVDEGLWTAARIHQYPHGGGFMGVHRDQTLTRVSEAVNLNYFQILLVMTRVGIDFEQGGGFIEIQGQRLIFEEYCQLGDLVVYDGQTLHGVADIDPHHLLDLDQPTGRLAAFVSLYKSL